MTLQAIADAEGVSKQAVSSSLQREALRVVLGTPTPEDQP